MKLRLLFLLLLPIAARAQFAPSASGSTTAAAEMNSKPGMQGGSGAPFVNCTTAHDLYVDDTGAQAYFCTGTNTWGHLQNFLGFTPENISNKDANNGYAGLTSGGLLKLAEAPIWNQNTTGLAGTASALAGTPTLCSVGNYPLGISPNGNALDCTALGAGGAVSSFNSRTGAVVPVSADYTCALVTNCVSTLGSYSNPTWLTSINWGIIAGVPALTNTFNSRSGTVVSLTADYTCAMVTNCVSTLGSYGSPSWITSINWSILVGSVPIFNQNTTGLAATASALAGTPTLCSVGNYPLGILPNGNATGCTSLGGGGTVSSFNSRTGAVVPATSDYTCAQVTNCVSTLGSYSTPTWLTAINWSIVGGAPGTFNGATNQSLSTGSSPITETWTVGSGGVTQYTLVQSDTSAPLKIVGAATGIYGVAMTTAISGPVEVARYGTVNCVTDTGGATAGDLVVIGTGTVIDCKDSGQTSSGAIPIATRIVGVFRSTATAGASALVELTPGHFGTLVTSGSGNAAAVTPYTVGSSITLTCPSSTAGTLVEFSPTSSLALTSNATTTLTGCTPGSDITLIVIQATSPTGPFTLTVPSGFDACVMGPASANTTTMKWSWDGTKGHLISCNTTGQGALTETAAPSGSPTAGTEYPWADATGLFARWKNSAGTIFQAAKEGTGIRIGGGANTSDSFISPDTNTGHALCGGSPPAFGTSCSGGGGTAIQYQVFRSIVNNTIAGSNFSIPANCNGGGTACVPTPVTVEGASSGDFTTLTSAWAYGTLSFAANSTANQANVVQGSMKLGSTWVSASGITLQVTWRTSATTGNALWQIQGQCVASGAPPGSFSASTPFTASAAAGASEEWTQTAVLTLTTSNVLSGCSAGNVFLFRLARDHQNAGDTITVAEELVMASFGVTE